MDDDYLNHCNTNVLGGLGHKLVSVTSENKHQLLSAAYQKTQERSEEASRILARLSQLNPQVGALFRPKEEALSRLRLRMVVAASPHARSAPRPIPSFIAVSYAWHNTDWNPAAAAVSIASGWKISRPMVDAVMACRESDQEAVWIDRLCINQDDDHDRTTHLSAMDLLYKSARRMIILLEDVQLSMEEASAGTLYAQWFQDLCAAVTERELEGAEKSKFVKAYMFGRDQDYIENAVVAEPADRRQAAFIAAFSRLVVGRRDFATRVLAARWFSRAWCAHESRATPHRMSDNPLMLCFAPDGTVLSFEFRFVFWLSGYIAEVAGEAGDMHWAAVEVAKKDEVADRHKSSKNQAKTQAANDFGDSSLSGLKVIIRLTDITRELPRHFQDSKNRIFNMCPARSANLSALDHLFGILSFGCSVMGDLLSIALNTSSTPLSFCGKVDTVEELVWIFCLVAKDFIELDLLIFETIPAEPSHRSLKKAAVVIDQFGLHAKAQQYLATLNTNTSTQISLALVNLREDMIKRKTKPRDVFLKTWLAHGIDCGFAWMARFPDTMLQSTQEGYTYGVIGDISDDQLIPAARALSAMTAPADNSLECMASWLGLGQADNTRKMVRFLRTILDPRLKPLAAQPRRLAIGPNDHAIITQTTNVGYIAVPLAVAHAPAHLDRAWVVEPFDPVAERLSLESAADHLPEPARDRVKPGEKVEDVFPVLTSDFEDRRRPRDDDRATWRMRGNRHEIFGCQDFGPIIARLAAGAEIQDEGGLVLLRKQKVYGAKRYDWKAVYGATQRLQARLDENTGDETGRQDGGSELRGIFKRLFDSILRLWRRFRN
ncbi:heterokaryon incompatibility protein-domain-containing protein [Microdochium bolleyi]|uniref:Heterokaryon incompatibility protein-domain-containing protein n=1 Tax=Microdochium bolleyi TaxID=196109 RepID=A0A136J8M7_9PEZI|nr:heterokaryon incompatibility protein-domain-containing protein [Microdochium bolleyi]